MWISQKAQALIGEFRKECVAMGKDIVKLEAENARLRIENERLRSDQDWFKLRLNQVERERGQLIQAAIGVKIAVPEFVPTYEDPGSALNQMPDLSTVGMDAKDEGAPVHTSADAGEGIDYSQMPGYTGDRR